MAMLHFQRVYGRCWFVQNPNNRDVWRQGFIMINISGKTTLEQIDDQP